MSIDYAWTRWPTPAEPAGLQRDLGWMLGVVFRTYVNEKYQLN